MTSTIYMWCHSVSDTLSGECRTCGHATTACGGYGYWSWCTPHAVDMRACVKMNAKIARFSRPFRATLQHISVRNVGVDTGKARGSSRAICGAPWRHSVSKGGHFFSSAPGFYFS